jgi:hypothetical protein
MKVQTMTNKTLLIAIAFMAIGIGRTQAEVTVQFSTSGTDASAGSELNMLQGETGSMFIWMATGTEASETLAGVALDVDSSDPEILEAVAHVIANPDDRWAQVTEGDLGDLTRGSQVFALPGFGSDGLFTDGEFLLYSEVQFKATGVGTTELSFLEGGNGFGDLDGVVEPVFANTATVVSEVPEPSTLLLCTLGIGLGAMVLRRRKSS